MAVAVIHNIYAVVVFGGDYVSLYENNVIDSVRTAHVGLAVWFFLFGQVLFLVGLLMLKLEQANSGNIPKSIAYNLLAFTMIGVVLMPVSGFWLMFPPIITVLLSKTTVENSKVQARIDG